MIANPLDQPPCPFPLSHYALVTYGRTLCEKLLSDIQVCSHGWLCGKCCHPYDGKMYFDGNAWTVLLPMSFRNKLGRSEQVRFHLSKFFYLFFNQWGLLSRILIERMCRETLCCNIQHMKVSCEHFSSEKIHDYIAFYTERCIHGSQCTDCCWHWGGGTLYMEKTGVTQPVFTPSDGRTYIVSYIYYQKNVAPLHRTDWIISQKCEDSLCVNIHHFYVKVINREGQQPSPSWKRKKTIAMPRYGSV